MSRNIKDIGKELMGKSLNSFHRKTGLTQLEKNNKMQDGILNGILSQVDDAYIEKTEQSNVIHLEGSGDGVVVLDSIEGNTMVNIMPLANWGNKSSDNRNCAYSQVRLNTLPFKPNTTYTTILLNAEGIVKSHWMHSLSTQGSVQGTIATFTTISDISMATSYLHIYFGDSDNTVTQEQINNIKVVVLEGDWTNKEINYFEGLQSSFEEHKEDDKYKIEILSRNQDNSKQNKRKLLLNSPLLKGDKIVCKEDGLYHYHKMGKELFDGSIDESWVKADTNWWGIPLTNCSFSTSINTICDKLIPVSYDNRNTMNSVYCVRENLYTRVVANSLSEYKQWLQDSPMTVVYELEEPYYEKITNEYGEPILLEGYENGTLYIDSVIVPTTTVKYTPKMESFNALKEVNDNNIMLTNDIEYNIIPYMMDVDLMIMEKEMALLSHKNIKTMEVLDMTSMQKRTQDMLERLIKGKTLTEQECKTRVTTYLNANKITDEQAEELMLLISEVYA